MQPAGVADQRVPPTGQAEQLQPVAWCVTESGEPAVLVALDQGPVARPIAGTTPQAVVTGLTRRWQLSFGPEAAGAGISRDVGWAGDRTRKERELLAIVESDASGALRDVYCSGGGTTVTVGTDQQLRAFIYDCAARTAGPAAWAGLKPWLDRNYVAPRAAFRVGALAVDVQSGGQWVRVQLTGV